MSRYLFCEFLCGRLSSILAISNKKASLGPRIVRLASVPRGRQNILRDCFVPSRKSWKTRNLRFKRTRKLLLGQDNPQGKIAYKLIRYR